jgi:hypothetical protein
LSSTADIFLKFADGELAHYLSAYNIVGLLEQLEALPPRGNRLGGAYVMSLLGARPSQNRLGSRGGAPGRTT